MILDPEALSRGELHRLMIGLIVPRPIAFISTVGSNGVTNLAPFSYFVPLTSKPPLVGVSINARAGGPKDTLRNIRASGAFVINIVSEPLLDAMVRTSGDWPPEVSEFALTGLTPVASDRVTAPGVGESPARLECRLEREVALGDTTFVIGEILRMHVAAEVLTDGAVDPLKLRPVGRLGGDAYAIVRDAIVRPRPKVPAA